MCQPILTISKSVVEDYVYPEIANEMLVKEGALRKTVSPLKENVLEDKLITSTTNVKKTARSGSRVVSELFDVLED